MENGSLQQYIQKGPVLDKLTLVRQTRVVDNKFSLKVYFLCMHSLKALQGVFCICTNVILFMVILSLWVRSKIMRFYSIEMQSQTSSYHRLGARCLQILGFFDFWAAQWWWKLRRNLRKAPCDGMLRKCSTSLGLTIFILKSLICGH